MSIISTSQVRSGDTVTVTAVSDLTAPTFYWYFDGAYLAATAGGTQVFTLQPGDQVRIHVLDSEDPNFDPIADGPVGYPARVTLEWIRALEDDTSHYRIEQSKNFGPFTLLGKVKHIIGQWSYRFVTSRLDDLASYTWQITPVDSHGNLGPDPVGTPSRQIVRWPDAPNFTATFDSGDIDVEAA